MNRRLSASVWFGTLLLLASALSVQAQFTWLGLSPTDGNITDARNWTPSAPTGVGSESLTFGTSGAQTNILFSASATFTNLTFDGTGPAYTVSGTGSPALTLLGDLTMAGSNPVTFNSSLSIALSSTTHNITVTGTAPLQINSGISGGGASVVKAGTGTLTLTGANTYTGSTTINGGTVSVSTLANGGSASSIGASSSAAANLILNGGTLRYTGGNGSTDRLLTLDVNGGTLDVSNPTVAGGFTFSNTGSIVLSGTNTARTLNLTGNPAYSSTVYFYPQIDDNGTGATSVVAQNGSFWRFAAANTYTGGTTVNSGGFLIAINTAGSATGPGTVTVNSGGRLGIGSNSPDGAISGDIVTSGTASVEFNRSTAYTYAGVISGTGHVLLTGAAGAITLTGANTYTGGTTIGGSTLQIGAGGTTGSITGDVTNNGALVFNRSDAVTYGGIVSGSGSLGIQGAGTLTLTGANTYTGGTTINGGTLALASPGAIGGSGTISFGGGTLQFSAANTTDYSSRFSTAASQAYSIDTNSQSVTFASALTSSGGSLTKFGAGALTLTGTNTYSGGTTINGGTLADGTGGASFSPSSTVQIASGANLNVNFNETVNGFTGTGGTAMIASSKILTINNAGDYSFPGVITGSGSLVKTGTGIQTLTGANTYTGGTTVKNGTLQVAGGSITDSASYVYVGDVSGDNGALAVSTTGSVTGNYLYLGRSSSSTGTASVSGAGSTWHNTNGAIVGSSGIGFLTIGSGGSIFDGGSSSLGDGIGGIGTAGVDGAGSTWTITNNLSVGNAGTGTLAVTNGGAVSSKTGYIGSSGASAGNVTVSGTGSSWSNSQYLYVGNAGTGALAITNGGSVSNTYSYIGSSSGSSGIVAVNGAGSSWTNSSYLYVGNSGTGTLAISSGGTVTSPNTYIGKNAGGAGTVTIDGAGSSLVNSSNLYVGSSGSGSLTLTNGAHATNVTGTISNNTGGGTASVSGAGSVWTNTGDLIVGYSGVSGSLSAYSGGVVNSANGYVAYNPATAAYAYVTGPISTWNLANSLYIGYQGSGVFFLNGNGVINVASGTGTVYLGDVAGSAGQLFIGSEGGTGGAVDAAVITTGSGAGSLNFQTSTTSASPYYLTKDGTSTGVPVTISGPTMVAINGGYNVLSGANTYSGGTFVNSGTIVAASNNALGTGSVTFSASGTLSVASGITLANPLILTSGGTLAGNGTFGSAVSAGTGVTLSPGNSPGNLTFSSGLTFAPGGVYDWQLQSVAGAPLTGAGTNWDLITVSAGTLDLSTLTPGSFTLKVISLNSSGTAGNVSDFSPASNYTWTVATAPTIAGFSTANFTIDTTGFSNPNIGSFSLSVSGSNLNLNFTAVPEPSTYALMLLGLGGLTLPLIRRRRS